LAERLVVMSERGAEATLAFLLALLELRLAENMLQTVEARTQ
jgi:hypothetical protein